MWGWEDAAFGPRTLGQRQAEPQSDTGLGKEKALSRVIDCSQGTRRVQIQTWEDPVHLNTCTVGKGPQVWT